jgi:hypothetical protein
VVRLHSGGSNSESDRGSAQVSLNPEEPSLPRKSLWRAVNDRLVPFYSAPSRCAGNLPFAAPYSLSWDCPSMEPLLQPLRGMSLFPV